MSNEGPSQFTKRQFLQRSVAAVVTLAGSKTMAEDSKLSNGNRTDLEAARRPVEKAEQAELIRTYDALFRFRDELSKKSASFRNTLEWKALLAQLRARAQVFAAALRDFEARLGGYHPAFPPGDDHWKRFEDEVRSNRISDKDLPQAVEEFAAAHLGDNPTEEDRAYIQGFFCGYYQVCLES